MKLIAQESPPNFLAEYDTYRNETSSWIYGTWGFSHGPIFLNYQPFFSGVRRSLAQEANHLCVHEITSALYILFGIVVVVNN
jgi:hypothetical protein